MRRYFLSVELNDEARELLIELDVAYLLPANAKIFCMHQGYEINYFPPSSNDPPVFQFLEGQSSVLQPWTSFSEYLRTSIEDHLTQWRDLVPTTSSSTFATLLLSGEKK